MFEFSGPRVGANEQLSRRGVRRAGVLGLGGLSLVDLARARADQSRQADDLSVILVWLDGGPPQHETYDPKPASPGGDSRTLAALMSTCVPGIDVSEVLPCHAAVMDKMSIIRSMRHTLDVNFGDHFTAQHVTLTGYNGGVRDGRTAPVNPSFGSVVARLKGARRGGVPPYVGLPEMHTTNLFPGYHSRDLPGVHVRSVRGERRSHYRPYRPPNLSLPDEVSLARLENRRALRAEFDLFRRAGDSPCATDRARRPDLPGRMRSVS